MDLGGDQVFLRGATFYGYHGTHVEETTLGQRFAVDIVAYCDLKPAGMSDDLSRTVNYGDLWEIAQEIVEGSPRALVESVAESIATTALERFPLIEAIDVEVRKPNAPIKTGGLDHVGVRIHRERRDHNRLEPES